MGPRRRQAHDRSTLPLNMTVSELSAKWLKEVAVVHQDKPRTGESYESVARVHILPRLGTFKVRSVSREDVKDLLLAKREAGKSKKTTGLILAVARAMLGHAKEAHLIAVNPAGDRLGAKLGLTESKRASQESTKKLAFDREELARLLETARTSEDSYHRRLHPMLFTMARTGLRVGEAIGLRWEDLNLKKRTAYVLNAISKRRHSTPKSGIGRTIQLSPQVVQVLEDLYSARQIEQLERGWPEDAHVFVGTTGKFYESTRAAKAFKEILGLATLPARHSLKSLRHTYGSQLIAVGVSPAFVQQQMGHANVETTLKTYGAWLPFAGGQAAVALLDDVMTTAEKPEMVSPR
jgi:integrase